MVNLYGRCCATLEFIWHQIIIFNYVFFPSFSVVHHHVSIWHNIITISLGEEQWHIMLHDDETAADAVSILRARIPVYSSFWCKQPIVRLALKSNPFSRFQASVYALLCAFFDKSSEPADFTSLSIVYQQEMNGSRAFVSCCLWGKGGQQRKISFRVSSEKFICDINIWYVKHGCVCAHQDKVSFQYFFPRTCQWVWMDE